MSQSETAPATKDFVISRVFDAPRDLVWKAHSKLEGLKHWWGPKGFTWVTGTAMAGRPYTTACSPTRV